MSAHQQLSPALEDKLAYFGTVATLYEAAAKLGYAVEDTTIRASEEARANGHWEELWLTA